MKRATFFIIFCCFSITIFADHEQQVIINQKGGHHFDLPVPAVQPEVYYNPDIQEIIIIGTGNLSYYDVEIESATTWYVYISTQVNGFYDTIDVSSLPSDTYTITIDTSVGLSYEGQFVVN